MRNYTIQNVPGAHLNFSQRQTLASDWNATVRAGCRITLRQFAAKHGLKYETWRREYRRGSTGAAVPDPKDRRRRKYAEYDPFRAQDEINENNGNKGAKMLVTNRIAFLFKRHVVDERLGHVTQDDDVAALRRMIARKALGRVRSVMTALPFRSRGTRDPTDWPRRSAALPWLLSGGGYSVPPSSAQSRREEP